MRDAVTAAAARVREGAPIGRSLAQSKLFPPMTVHLISSGESSGELDNMLDRAATNQERELDSMMGALVGLLNGVRGIEVIRFTSGDVVRRDLVARIVEAYDKAGPGPARP